MTNKQGREIEKKKLGENKINEGKKRDKNLSPEEIPTNFYVLKGKT